MTKFNHLTLLEKRAAKSNDGHIVSLWQCDCGNTALIAFSRVKCGTTRSCGCIAVPALRAANTRHGGRKSREYSSWTAMKSRCLNPRSKDFARYGGAGITIAPEWLSFEAFLRDMGPRPAGTSLDRIDATKGYEPGNVRWASDQVQGRNRRKTYVWHIKGRTFQTIGEAAQAFGVSQHTVSRWVNGAFDARRGTSTPPRSDCTVEERY